MKKLSYLFIFLAAFLIAFAIHFMVKRSALNLQVQNPVISSQKNISISCGMPPDERNLYTIPALTGWGNYKWKISTRSDSAQFYFNQGINMYYAFHTLESLSSFAKAIQFDSSCAMAWYGKALALGPTINYGNGYRAPGHAWLAAKRSKEYEDSCTDLEKGLIHAISQRYSPDTTANLKDLQQKYSDAMYRLSVVYPNNADVLTLYADALMVEHPWDLYDKELQPKSWTPQILAVLDQALAITPLHPGANHYRVHVLEGSIHPEEALKNAEILAGLMPDVAHITHMPSHIYIRTGNYIQGMQANDKALKGYNKYLRLYKPVKNNALLYQIHAEHMKFNCALDAGSYSIATQTSDSLWYMITPEFLSNTGALGSFLQYAYQSRLFAELRFGNWKAILQEPVMDSLPYAVVLGHFGRGMAFSHLNRIPEAEKELILLRKSMLSKVLKEPFDPFSSAFDASLIAENILLGVLAEEKHQYQEAVEFFIKAVVAEDNLIYDEPRDWLLPARQYLGALLLKMGDYRQAIKVFNKDLVINPHNGWSLTGLQIAYTAIQDKESVKHIQKELLNAWQIKDVPVSYPVF